MKKYFLHKNNLKRILNTINKSKDSQSNFLKSWPLTSYLKFPKINFFSFNYNKKIWETLGWYDLEFGKSHLVASLGSIRVDNGRNFHSIEIQSNRRQVISHVTVPVLFWCDKLFNLLRGQYLKKQNFDYSGRFEGQCFNRYKRERSKVDASIFDSALSHTRRSDASE